MRRANPEIRQNAQANERRSISPLRKVGSRTIRGSRPPEAAPPAPRTASPVVATIGARHGARRQPRCQREKIAIARQAPRVAGLFPSTSRTVNLRVIRQEWWLIPTRTAVMQGAHVVRQGLRLRIAQLQWLSRLRRNGTPSRLWAISQRDKKACRPDWQCRRFVAGRFAQHPDDRGIVLRRAGFYQHSRAFLELLRPDWRMADPHRSQAMVTTETPELKISAAGWRRKPSVA